MASACALAIFSGKNILNFGISERLRAFRYPIFTGRIVKAEGISNHFSRAGSQSEPQHPPKGLTLLGRCRVRDLEHIALGGVNNGGVAAGAYPGQLCIVIQVYMPVDEPFRLVLVQNLVEALKAPVGTVVPIVQSLGRGVGQQQVDAARPVCLEPEPPHPAAQGIVQMIGVFIDTIVICTASAIIVMLAPRPDNEYTLNGIQDLQHAMSVLVGGWGAGFIALIVLLFAFSSIVANYVYAENNLVFLRLDKPRYIWGLRILTVLMVLLGTMVSLPVVWQSADIIMALMAMTNLTAILLLSPTVRIIASDYLRQRRLGIQPTFDATRYPGIDQQLAPGAWNELPRE